jgi:hypothetical protein
MTVLCCGKRRCPVISDEPNENGRYELTDDYNGKVELTKGELKKLQEHIHRVF